MVYRVIYISSTRRVQSNAEIDVILRTSQENNHRDGLTGLLIYDGKRFFQYLEGEEAQVRRTLARIRADERHYALVVLSEKETDRRQFGQWSMAGHYMSPRENLEQCVERLTTGCDPHVAAELRGFATVRTRAA